MKRKAPIILAAWLLALALPLGAAEAERRFVIVQPGYPGSTAEAETFVADLATAIGKGGGPRLLGGAYYNDEKEALKEIADRKPSFGIVSLGFFLARHKDLDLSVILASQPEAKFYLVAKKGQTVKLGELSGQTVTGTPFNEPRFVERILFGPGPDGKAVADIGTWKVEPAQGFSKAIRDVARGKARAALLTERERRGMESLTAGKDLEVAYETRALPTALVVAIGKETEMARQAAGALKAMKDVPDGQELLKMMGIEGFGSIDEKVLAALEERYKGAGGGVPAGAR
jgi:hypothetical protein